ncbi:MAG: hypothetical protein IT374_24940 [Polyangiaceae bacterium]|nr:hypothetical protein [Polyangiaceae bacterium]
MPLKTAALVTLAALFSAALLARCGGPSEPAAAAGAAGRAGRGGKGGKGGAGNAGRPGAAVAGATATAGAGSSPVGGPASGPAVRTVVGGDCPPTTGVSPHIDLSWIQYSGFGCELAVLVPGPLTPPIEPFEWGPCPPTASTTGECQQLKPLPDGGSVAAAQFAFARSPTGGALLAVHRYKAESYGYEVVGEADGRALLAVTLAGKTFSWAPAWFDSDAYALAISSPASSGGTEHGVVAGRFSDPAPSYVRRVPNAANGASSSWAVSGELVVRNFDGIHASRWLEEDGPAAYTSHDDPDRLPGYVKQVMGDRVFVQVNGNGLMGIVTWTEAEGEKPLLRYFGDYEKSAQRWSTDGVDMVWVEGDGPQSSIYVHPKMTVMTAPYSTDAEVIQQTKRSLGPSPAQMAANVPFPVGCGYAATPWYTDTANGLAIVRLSDGVWWRLVPNLYPYAARPLGVTCEHVYYEFANQVLRVRLASLPPGGLP